MGTTASSRLVEKLRRRVTSQRLNDWQSYHRMIAGRLTPGMNVLDVGCGSGAIAPFPWNEHPGVRLTGLDPDPAAAANPYVEEFLQLKSDADWPVRSDLFDLVLSRYVLEHVADVASFLREVYRTLKPGGEFLFLTPNRRHPAMLASDLLPHSVKQSVLGHTRGVEEHDIFPTAYAMNTPKQIATGLGAAGLTLEFLETREFVPCEYLAFSAPTYLVACAYYGFVRGTGLEPVLGAQIIGRARKPAAFLQRTF